MGQNNKSHYHVTVMCRECGKLFDLLKYWDYCPYCHIAIPFSVVEVTARDMNTGQQIMLK